MNKIVVTGCAGFIGFHLVNSLLENQENVVIGIDNLSPSYGGYWSEKRLKAIPESRRFRFENLDLAETNVAHLSKLFDGAYAVIHLAAWPGVRNSQLKPHDYSVANLNAFGNILEAIRSGQPRQFLFASSSSIYGDLGVSGAVKEDQATGKNLRSYYAATKWANEILAKSHQAITLIPTVALRFFTVYGEYGRPDMAYWMFAENISRGEEVRLYGETGGSRNFTFIDDTVEILQALLKIHHQGFEAFNISTGEPSETIKIVNELSKNLKLPAKIKVIQRPDVDVEKTWADLNKIQSYVGVTNATTLNEGILRFSKWFLLNGTK